MLKTTRTRLTLTTLERRETPAKFDPINMPAEPAATIKSDPVRDLGHDSDTIYLEEEATQDPAASNTRSPNGEVNTPVAMKETSVSVAMELLELAKVK